MRIKTAVLVAVTAILVLIMSNMAFAYTQDEIDRMTGPATGVSSTYTADGVSQTPAVQYGDLINATDNQDGTYTFEGKTFIIESDWGQHCLTGYSDTGSKTASGVMPQANHTVSGPKSMLGKYCLVKGVGMMNNKTGQPKLYDGIYKFEDTGGAAVETGTDRTMNVPVVDIYQPTQEAALNITANGTIIAQVYILRETN